MYGIRAELAAGANGTETDARACESALRGVVGLEGRLQGARRSLGSCACVHTGRLTDGGIIWCAILGAPSVVRNLTSKVA